MIQPIHEKDIFCFPDGSYLYRGDRQFQEGEMEDNHVTVIPHGSVEWRAIVEQQEVLC